MQTAFIIFGAVAGGIFFNDFAKMEGWYSYVLYAVGILFSVGGLCLLASGVEQEGPTDGSSTKEDDRVISDPISPISFEAEAPAPAPAPAPAASFPWAKKRSEKELKAQEGVVLSNLESPTPSPSAL